MLDLIQNMIFILPLLIGSLPTMFMTGSEVIQMMIQSWVELYRKIFKR